jgi:hypothetical protein
MPVYRVGDLVNPRMNPILNPNEDNPDAIGLIVEMRSMRHMKPEAKILWNDMLDAGPRWTFIDDVEPLGQQACNGPETVV